MCENHFVQLLKKLETTGELLLKINKLNNLSLIIK